jgi:L-ribulose-5-phosphate 4-epimerase
MRIGEVLIMLEKLRQEVCDANLALPAYGLVTFTWGNVSGIDREHGLVVIKPSGLSYEGMRPEHMVIVNLKGEVVEGELRPSSDLATHLELYKAFPELAGIVHTHSTQATAWAQACRPIPCFGTTHADYFHGEIPLTRALRQEEIEGAYEKNTGLVIIETFKEKKLDPVAVPAVLCASHGPFAWGKDVHEAVHNAVVLEEVAQMAQLTLAINPLAKSAPQYLMDKHYYRKHGANAYYGQKKR